MQQIGGNADDVVLETLEALESGRVQAVRSGKCLVGLAQEVFKILVQVIGQTPDSTRFVVRVLAGETLQFLKNVRARTPGFGQAGAHA